MRKLDASENSLFMNIPRNYPCVEKKHYNKTGNARLAKLASTVREASASLHKHIKHFIIILVFYIISFIKNIHSEKTSSCKLQ